MTRALPPITPGSSSRPTAGGHVLTEETQQGTFWEELAKKMPDGLHHFHQDWVEKLAEVAETDAAKTS